MEDISGFGLQVLVIGSVTYPSGIVVTQFADDADPFDIPPLKLMDTGMGLNGDMVAWSTATPLEVVLNVIPGSENDDDLSHLAEANRVGKGKNSARDVISLVAVYPDGKTRTLKNGKLVMAALGKSISSAHRTKSKAFTFRFENTSKSGGGI